ADPSPAQQLATGRPDEKARVSESSHHPATPSTQVSDPSAGPELQNPPDAPPVLDLEEAWRRAMGGLGDALSPQHRAWVNLTRPLGLLEDTVLLAAPNDLVKEV